MKSALLVSALLAATAQVASAGAYVGLGLSPTPAASDSLSAVATPDGRGGRALLGFRFANLSFEGALAGVHTLTAHGNDTLYTAWAAGKLSLPLGSGFEVFGRLGVHHTWTSVDQGPTIDIAGNGLLVGAGAEYNLNLVATKISLWVDYTLAHAALRDQPDQRYGLDYDTTLRTWTLGISVGI